MRHGQARLSRTDYSRPLTDLGKQQAKISGIWLHRYLDEKGITPANSNSTILPLTSPLKRTVETARIVERQTGLKFSTERLFQLDACPETACSYTETCLDTISTLIIISHQPLLFRMLQRLSHTQFSFPEASLCTLENESKELHWQLANTYIPTKVCLQQKEPL